MKVLVTGSSGFIGSALVPYLAGQGCSVTRLVRRRAWGSDEVAWDPEAGVIDEAGLSGADAVVHLAGRNIAEGRWTDRQRALIRDSRVQGTRLLSDAVARLDAPPRVLACATAAGYYGSRGEETLTEDALAGSDFLAGVVREAEAATAPAASAGIRVVNMRIGVVLDASGGALRRMLPSFKLGLGGRLGSGRQYWPWISRADLLRVFHHVLVTETLDGPLNVCSPGVVTNAELTEALGRVLSRPTLFRVPAPALRLVFGGVSEAMLSSQLMDVTKLVESGFQFRHREIEDTLRALLRE